MNHLHSLWPQTCAVVWARKGCEKVEEEEVWIQLSDRKREERHASYRKLQLIKTHSAERRFLNLVFIFSKKHAHIAHVGEPTDGGIKILLQKQKMHTTTEHEMDSK